MLTGVIMNNIADHKKDGDLVEVVVKSQNGPFEGTFKRTDTVQAVITAAANKLGINQADRLELVLEKDRGKVLNPSTTLGSLLEHEHDHDKRAKLVFVLTAIGSGV